jgi:hypothetical protein
MVRLDRVLDTKMWYVQIGGWGEGGGDPTGRSIYCLARRHARPDGGGTAPGAKFWRAPLLSPEISRCARANVSRWRGVNSTNVLDGGLRIGEIGCRMNSKVNSVKQGGYKSKRGCRTWLAFNLSHTVPSWPLYIDDQVSRIGWDPTQLQYRHTVRTRISTSITIGPSLTGLRGTQLMGSIIYTLISSPWDSTRIADLGWISNLLNLWLGHFFDFFISSNLRICLSTYNISQGVLMNKPDNSDGSRGQLTAGTDTYHLLQIQSSWTWIRETGQIHSFAAFKTYKKWILVVLRVPSASTRIFLCVVDTDTYQQSASICVYQATQDGS